MKDVLWVAYGLPDSYIGHRVRFSRYTRGEPDRFYPDEVLYVKVEEGERERYAVYAAMLDWKRPTIN